MIIPPELAQRIVDTAQGLVHRNVNIMNREGIIIGTAQPHRRRTFHKGALDAVEMGRAVEIAEDQTASYPGARPGVNLPIVLEGQIIGVIGVTGDPAEVRGTARLIKLLTELLLERELVQNMALHRLKSTEQLMEYLLWQNTAENLGRIRRLARDLGLDLSLPRAAVVADVSPLLADFAQRYGTSELVQERAAEAILQRLGERGLAGAQDPAVLINGRLVLLRTLPAGEAPAASRRLAGDLARGFADWSGGEFLCGIGALAEAVGDYAHSLRQAEYCLRAAGPGATVRSVYEPGLSVGYVLHEAAAGPAGMVLKPLRAAVERTLSRKPELARTLRALLARNLDGEAAADALGVHRNTLTYRLGRFREATGLDPVRRLDDAVILRLLTDAASEAPV